MKKMIISISIVLAVMAGNLWAKDVLLEDVYTNAKYKQTDRVSTLTFEINGDTYTMIDGIGGLRNDVPDFCSYGNKKFQTEQTVPDKMKDWYLRVRRHLLKKCAAAYEANIKNPDVMIRQMSPTFGSRVVIKVSTDNVDMTVTGSKFLSTEAFTYFSRFDRENVVDVRGGNTPAELENCIRLAMKE